jgi:Ca-activated chloride channel family protein
MFRFEHPDYLYALLLIPVFLLLFIAMLFWKKKAIKRYGDRTLLKQLMPDSSQQRLIFKFILYNAAYLFLVIAIANPQTGSKLVEVERKGIDLVIALDVSNSMLAEDVKPNRLELSKQAISKLIDKLGNDRIGIVVFAGKAYTQLPITTDYAAAKMFVNTIDTKVIPTQGTAIGDAIELSMQAFDEETHSKAIIVITDGENHEDDAVDLAASAAEKGIQVYTVGIGSPVGVPIPEYNRYNQRTGYKTDRQGKTVVTKLNETMLKQIATAGEGVYVTGNNTYDALDTILEEINKMEKTEFESKMFSDYEDRFQYFIALSLILLFIELLIFEKKNKWLSKIDLFK